MDTLVLIVIVVLVALAAFLIYQRSQSKRLEQRFGPEYERAVDDADSRRQAEKELSHREERRKELDIRRLDPQARQRYQEQWADVQQRFVDEPQGAVMDADRLVIEVMRDRGYPIEDFDQRAADISVDHPRVVDSYRSAHAIAVRVEGDRADTEDLRQAVVHYRSLFEDLLDGKEPT